MTDAFETYERSYIEFLHRLNLLSTQGFTGSFRLYLEQGRVAERTFRRLKRMTAALVQQYNAEAHADGESSRR